MKNGVKELLQVTDLDKAKRAQSRYIKMLCRHCMYNSYYKAHIDCCVYPKCLNPAVLSLLDEAG